MTNEERFNQQMRVAVTALEEMEKIILEDGRDPCKGLNFEPSDDLGAIARWLPDWELTDFNKR